MAFLLRSLSSLLVFTMFMSNLLFGIQLAASAPVGELGFSKANYALSLCSSICFSASASRHCSVLAEPTLVNGSCVCHCAVCSTDDVPCSPHQDTCRRFGRQTTTSSPDSPLCCRPCLDESPEPTEATDFRMSFVEAERFVPMAQASRFHEEERAADENEERLFGEQISTVKKPTSSVNKTLCLNINCPAVPGCVSYRHDNGKCCPVCVERSCSECQPVAGCVRYKPLKAGQCCAECVKKRQTIPVGPCAKALCPRNRVCRAIDGVAQCQCKITCTRKRRKVCGSNGKTYRNTCFLRRASCLSGRVISVQRKGKC